MATRKPSAAVQAQIDAAVQAALTNATAGLVATGGKPHEIDNLRKVWRASAEHKAAQIKRFLSAMGAVLGLQLVSDFSTGKNPLEHFTDLRTAWFYLLPFALVAWRQLHPALTASQADSAPGVTIVPDQTADGGMAVEDTASPDLSAAGSITGLGGVPVAPDAVGAGPAEGDAAP